MRKMPNKGRTEKNMKRIISVLLCALMIVAVMVIPATATTSYTFPKAAETFNLTDGKDPNGVSYTIANGKATVGVNTYSDSCPAHIWQAVFAACDLFRQAAVVVAKHFDFSYSTLDDMNMTNYLKAMASLR